MSQFSKTAGVWDPKGWPIYFAASNILNLERAGLLENMLVAVNELRDTDLPWLEDAIAKRKNILIDSGVYWLATQHAQKHDVTMDVALSLAPNEIDDFEELLERYIKLVSAIGHKAWGYIEIDQGGKANKRNTRKRLEGLGLQPIPVYHPINDGWDYFDELAESYDRICLGNIVKADPATRKRLIATAWERRRKYPNLWIHGLGLTPSELTIAYPINSCDSSTWMDAVRWGDRPTRVAIHGFDKLDRRFIYKRGKHDNEERANIKGTRMCGYIAALTNRTMGVIANEQRDELGADIGLFK